MDNKANAGAKSAEDAKATKDAEMAQWKAGLMEDFKKIIGSSYDANSSMDMRKMKILADMKRDNPGLSTNALALKIYRSGLL
jgi:hypothetical protein